MMRIVLSSFFLLIAFFSHAQDFEIYVSDAGNFDNPPWQILKFDENGQNPSVFISTNLNWPQDILFLEDDNEVLISNLGSGCIAKYNATTGAFISNFACSISGPTRMKIGPDGTLYVLQWNGAGIVRRYNLDGTFLGNFTSVGVSQSIGLDWDSENNLYVSSYNGDLVRKFDNSGNDLGIFINSNLLGPTNIWFDSNGDLLVSDYNGTAVKRFNSSGVFTGNFMEGLSNSEGVDFLPNGNILIGNGQTRSVKMYNSSGTYIEEFIASGSGNLLTPNAVVIRPINVTSIAEPDNIEANILFPTIGTEFVIDQHQFVQIESIVIYDATGKVVGRREVLNNSVLNVNHLSEGVHFIKFRFGNSQYKTERIVIQK